MPSSVEATGVHRPNLYLRRASRHPQIIHKLLARCTGCNIALSIPKKNIEFYFEFQYSHREIKANQFHVCIIQLVADSYSKAIIAR